MHPAATILSRCPRRPSQLKACQKSVRFPAVPFRKLQSAPPRSSHLGTESMIGCAVSLKCTNWLGCQRVLFERTHENASLRGCHECSIWFKIAGFGAQRRLERFQLKRNRRNRSKHLSCRASFPKTVSLFSECAPMEKISRRSPAPGSAGGHCRHCPSPPGRRRGLARAARRPYR